MELGQAFPSGRVSPACSWGLGWLVAWSGRNRRRAGRRVLIGAVGLSIAVAPGRALAAGFTVTSTNDAVDVGGCVTPGAPCTLRDAVKAADAAGGSSTITLPAGTYALTVPPGGGDDILTGDLNVTAAITISGAGSGSTIIDGGGGLATVTDRVFRVESTGSLTLSGMTVQHGHPAGGRSGTLSEGGGILAYGPLTLTDASVSNNFVDGPAGAGAGIAQESAPSAPVNVPVSLTRVNVSSNMINVSSGHSGNGGGLMINAAGTSPVTVTESTISNNAAAGAGGGLYVASASGQSPITIRGSAISGNHAALPPGLTTAVHAYGGGLATDGGSTVNLSNDTVANNTADEAGGGILDNASDTYTITNSTISGNTAVAGFVGPGNFLGGGGIVANGGSFNPGWTLSGDTISGNTAGSPTNPNVPGGGIDEDGGDVFTIVNTTIEGNTASGVGGGYESSGGGTHKLTNVTIDSNTAGSGGGDVDNSGGGHFTLANTIIARGTPVNCAVANASALPTSLGHNLDTGTSCGFAAAGDLSNQAQPGLAPLANNGGSALTEALLPGSPAIDSGDNSLCPPVDQRGVSRPQNGACDIGAFELVPAPTLTGLRPSSGPAAGGTAVTITGSQLSGATGVNFGVSAAASFSVHSDNQITATSPPGLGTVDVTVTTPGGTTAASSADRFTYTPPPAIVMVSAPAVANAARPLVKGSARAAFTGFVNPEGLATSAHFEYGLDSRYRAAGGMTVYDQSTRPQQVGSDVADHLVSASVSGLFPNALYHVRLVASNGAGVTRGPDQTFVTRKDPAPPPPALGKSFDAVPVSGIVFVKPPAGRSLRPFTPAALIRGQGFVPLTEARQIPSGSQIDARQGSLKIIAAAATRVGKKQTGVFAAALFGLGQARSGVNKGLTTLSLKEGAFPSTPSYANCNNKAAADSPSIALMALSNRVLQTLRARAHGRFRTRGRYSAGTVRGTTWDTIDRCDGTVTVVHRGTVLVSDFTRRIVVPVHAGHSYLAKAARTPGR